MLVRTGHCREITPRLCFWRFLPEISHQPKKWGSLSVGDLSSKFRKI